ncbi:MAG: Glycerol-3-phosphate ABC transporter, ATP-binding protein UgpC [uncultured Thermomicrobiales bacterium]|uniref:Glycerol-3-phosphate ABC transporter, ATP-binding protein UgpC n=1 Tax=uncultured Thermomicrobiales bacterium TaxID=1645740 RepID=A0A6J4V5V8_9BACT|nr:MAG: Glycerol-3-phosphate ABC transporter, ATP-binding protein UgpC [uncultured Thermomicrobiales bacterium]
MAEIRLDGVTKTFDRKVRAVDDVQLTIADREFMVLLGPSGCGKTTLMRMIAGLEYPDGGRIAIGGRDVTDLPPRRRDIAMVFQSYAVFPHLTVFENIAFGLRMRKMAKAEVARKVERAAVLVQLEPYLGRYSAQLSGGQRQRVAVARAIVMEPSVLLMDEPLSNLDALLRLTFRAELKKLVAELNTTTIYVTHDQIEALSLGDRVAVMREGRVVQHGTPMAVYDRPATSFVGSFIGSPPMNFLRGRVEGQNGDLRVRLGEHALAAPAALAGHAGREVLLGIRAENIEAETTVVPDAISARTEVVEPLGSHLLLTAVVGDQRLKLQTRTDFPAAPDAPLWLRPEPDKLRWYDPETSQEIAAG